jgi:PDZ domain
MNRHRFARYAMFTLLACPLGGLAASPGKDYSQQLRDLDNPDPVVREQTRQDLMTLTRPQLDDLRQAVAQSPPLSPEQITALHEIVMQVILADAATAPAPADNAKGFLGARLDQCEAPGADGVMRPAILVCQRIPGFDAYRMLHTDDVILAVDGSTQETRDVQSFTAAVLSHSAGQQISLQILRGGRFEQVAVQLFARPESADNANLPDLLESRSASVEQYWRTIFEPAIRKSR